MTVDDIVRTLYELNMIFKDEVGDYCIRIDRSACQAYIDKIEEKGYAKVNPECLNWSPFLFKRSLPDRTEENENQ
jgi:hypothetical protein